MSDEDSTRDMAVQTKALVEAHIAQCQEERARVDSEFKELWGKLDKMNGKLWAILVLLLVVAVETAIQFFPPL